LEASSGGIPYRYCFEEDQMFEARPREYRLSMFLTGHAALNRIHGLEENYEISLYSFDRARFGLLGLPGIFQAQANDLSRGFCPAETSNQLRLS
jgi:hypothetical protein